MTWKKVIKCVQCQIFCGNKKYAVTASLCWQQYNCVKDIFHLQLDITCLSSNSKEGVLNTFVTCDNFNLQSGVDFPVKNLEIDRSWNSG